MTDPNFEPLQSCADPNDDGGLGWGNQGGDPYNVQDNITMLEDEEEEIILRPGPTGKLPDSDILALREKIGTVEEEQYVEEPPDGVLNKIARFFKNLAN